MSPETTKKVQLMLVAGILIAGARTAWIFYERKQDNAPAQKQEGPPLKADYYVTPKKLHPYNLESAPRINQAASLDKRRLPFHLLSLQHGQQACGFCP